MTIPPTPQLNARLLACFSSLLYRLAEGPSLAQMDLTPEVTAEYSQRHGIKPYSPRCSPRLATEQNVTSLAPRVWVEFDLGPDTRVGILARVEPIAPGDEKPEHPLYLADNHHKTHVGIVAPEWYAKRPPACGAAYEIVMSSPEGRRSLGQFYCFLAENGSPGEITSVLDPRPLIEFDGLWDDEFPDLSEPKVDLGGVAMSCLGYYFAAMSKRLAAADWGLQIPMQKPRTIPTAEEMAHPVEPLDILHPCRFQRSRAKVARYASNFAASNNYFETLQLLDRLELVSEARPKPTIDEEYGHEAPDRETEVCFAGWEHADFAGNRKTIFAFHAAAVRQLRPVPMTYDISKVQRSGMIYVSLGRQAQWEIRPGYFVDGFYAVRKEDGEDRLQLTFTTTCPLFDYSRPLNLAAYPDVMFHLCLLIRDDRVGRLRATLKDAAFRHDTHFPHFPRARMEQMTALAISALNHIHANKGSFKKGYPGLPGVAESRKMKNDGYMVAHIVE